MPTTAVFQSLKHKLLILGFLFLASCDPAFMGEDECEFYDGQLTVENLASITPVQDVYQQGDVIELSIVIPNENNFFNKPRNIFKRTKNPNWGCILFPDLFNKNDFIILEGTSRDLPFHFNLKLIEGEYRLTISISLNRIGQYSFNNEIHMGIRSVKTCEFYGIQTNFVGFDIVGEEIKFKVVE